ncbi:MAG: 1-acyl-sn-glycerol-3-phosphate acyltransferase [Actinomycetota bacterium]|nr:1-acyl-sn-glycerol-3-phosphate acyltransferase [Actinomycetota bacterium]
MRASLTTHPAERSIDRSRSVPVALIRSLLQRLFLFPVVGAFCRPFTVSGLEHVTGKAPFVFIANHSSHADTAVLLRALPARLRRKTAVAAAEDYFYSTRLKALAAEGIIGTFPFPRRGPAGLERARDLLDGGHSVLLFPEGTRGNGDAVGDFRAGIGVLAARGATIVPVGIEGTFEILPKGARRPRRAPVSVAFGKPMRFVAGAPVHPVAERLEGCVKTLRAEAERARLARPSLFARLRSFARSPRALGVTFVWAVGEALFWPVIPDFLIAPLAFVAPSRFVPLAAAAVAGSAAGGALAHVLATAGAGEAVMGAAPLLTDKMAWAAEKWLGAEGAAGLVHQPLSGVPYKAFALQSGSVDLVAFTWFTVVFRGARFAAVAAVFAAGGAGARGRVERAFPVLLAVYAAVFTISLFRVVASWS